MISRIKQSKFTIPTALLITSGFYYWALSSKIFTWIYTSGDAGDWLQQLNWWTVPHCFGKPLFIAIIHGLAKLPVENDIALLTTTLAIIPGAITVVITYFIGLEITKSRKLATVASLILISSGIFLSQTGVVEQYAFTAMLVSTAFLFYLKGKWAWAVIFLGLGTAVHIFVAITGLFWFAIEWKQWKRLLKLMPLFIVFGVLPYGLIVYLMASSAPNLVAGNLSWNSINHYLGNQTSTMALAISASPRRLYEAIGILLLALGLAWYPLYIGLKKPWDLKQKVAIVTIFWASWFYLTNLFPSTWKYVAMIIPIMAGFAVHGLSRLKPYHTRIIIISAIALIVLNSIFLNSDKLAREEPLATEFYNALWELEDGSAIATPRGGAYGFALFYAMSEGKDLMPIALSSIGYRDDASYQDYLDWLNKNYTIEGSNCLEMIDYAINNNIDTYFISPPTNTWSGVYTLEETGTYGLYRITDVDVIEDWGEEADD